MSDTFVSPVSRETGVTNGASVPRQPRDRRRDPRATVECPDGRIRRIGSAYSPQDIATLRRLVESHCTTPDIARHFNVTVPAIKMLMRRHAIKRPRPTVAEVLSTASTPHPEEPLPGGVSKGEPAHQASIVPVVTLTDRFERYVGMVELHEVYNGMARIRHVAGATGLDKGGHAGKWLTVPVLQLRFERTQDRAALLEQARERAAATEARRKALHSTSTEG